MTGVTDALPETFTAVNKRWAMDSPVSAAEMAREAGQEPHEAPAETNKQAMCTGGGQSRETAEQEATVNFAQHRGRAQERRDRAPS